MTDFAFSRRGFFTGAAALAASATLGEVPREKDGKVMMGFDETALGPLANVKVEPFSDRKVRIGIAGEGVCTFGSQFGYQNHPNAEVVACAELDAGKRAILQQRVRARRIYASCEEMIAREREIDAVYIATDAPSHARLAILALEHGLHVVSAVPAVFGEEQLEFVPKLVEAARRSGRLYMMNETSAFRANCYAMRKIFEKGGFGNVVYTEGEYFHHGVGKTVGSYLGWREGLPPLWYATHSTAYFTCVTHRRFTEVTCLGRPSVDAVERKRRYGNPFGSEVSFLACEGGGSARMAVCYDMPCVNSETGRLWGQKGSFVGDRFLGGEERLSGIEFLRPPLPPGMPAGGHGGSHGYLTDDFLRGLLVKGHKVCVDLKTALDSTIAGIYAHRSALRDGETLKIPSSV